MPFGIFPKNHSIWHWDPSLTKKATKKDFSSTISKVERSKLAVWDYPVSDKYTKV